MDGHGVDGYRHAGIEELVDRMATFGFEGDLAQAIGGTSSGGFCVEEDEHVVTDLPYMNRFRTESNKQRNSNLDQKDDFLRNSKEWFTQSLIFSCKGDIDSRLSMNLAICIQHIPDQSFPS